MATTVLFVKDKLLFKSSGGQIVQREDNVCLVSGETDRAVRLHYCN